MFKAPIATIVLFTTVLFSTVLLPSGDLAAQSNALRRAILIEEQEHDVNKAVELYRTIARAEDTTADDRTRAHVRLGKALRRLGKSAEARAALEQAAKGTGEAAATARALLQDKDQDSEKELRARARALLTQAKRSNLSERLLWIGPAAVPEIVARYEKDWRDRNPSYAQLVWELGGRHARKFLQRVQQGDHDGLRDTMATAIDEMHPELMDIALSFLADARVSTRSRLRVANHIAHRTPLEALIKLTASGDPKLVAGTISILTSQWASGRSPSERIARMKAIVPALRRSYKSENEQIAAATRNLLATHGLATREIREFVLDLLPEWPRNKRPTTLNRGVGGPIQHPASLAHVVRAARRMGPNRDDARAKWLEEVVRRLSSHWRREDLRDVLELVRLGYFRSMLTSNVISGWDAWLKRTTEQDGTTILQALDGSPALVDATGWMAKWKLSPLGFPILARAWKNLLPADREGKAYTIFECMGNTAHSDAVPFLLAAMRESEGLYYASCAGLVAWSKRKDSTEVREALRQALRFRFGRKDGTTALHGRTNALQQLMVLGDMPAVRMIPELDEKGMQSPERWLRELLSPEGVNKQHGFDDKGLAEAWGFLLGRGERFWTMAPELMLSWGDTYHIRPAMIDMLITRFDRLTKSGQPLFAKQYEVLGRLLDLPNSESAATKAQIAAIQHLTTHCLQSADLEQARLALSRLQKRTPTDSQRELVLQLLCGRDKARADGAVRVVNHKKVSLTEAEFASVLEKALPEVRIKFLHTTLHQWTGKAVTALLPFVKHPDSSVRYRVCNHLGRCADTRAVGPLLEALRDHEEGVRKAADEALRAIRFYHEQKAHWDRAFQGPTVNANNAAEALLKQAEATEKKPTRLLAIRSLGLLGKVETLPFLIEFSKEKDVEIAAAAKQAIRSVHEKAAGKK